MRITHKNNPQLESREFNQPDGSVEKKGSGFGVVHGVLLCVIVLSLLVIAFLSLSKSVELVAIDATTTPFKQNPQETPIKDARIEVQSWFALPLFNRVLLLPGKHSVSVSATGYKDRLHTIEVEKKRQQTIRIALERLPGNLEVQLVPKGIQAEVFIDQDKHGLAPGLIRNIPAGEQRFVFTADLHQSLEKNIFIEGKEQTQTELIELKPAWAYVSFKSTPAGASVFVGEKEIGQTPLKAKVSAGEHTFVFRLKAYSPQSIKRTIQAKVDVDLVPVKLTPADGILQLTSEPNGSTVMLNKVYQGLTPITLHMASSKNNTISLFKPGFKPKTLTLNLKAEQEVEQTVKLIADTVPVEFSVFPKDAHLSINGKEYPTQQRIIHLPTLPQTVQLSKKGYVSVSQNIVPLQGKKQLVSIRLLTNEQAFWKNTPEQYRTDAGQTMRLFKTPGLVKMGSARREAGRRANEVEQTARLSKSFYVSLHEVTNKQYRQFVKNHSSGHYKRKSLDNNNKPVVNVSWQQAALYCNWLSRKEKLPEFYQTKAGFVSGVNPEATGYRLLTEAEWDWLARNNTKMSSGVMTYPWGNQNSMPTKPTGNYADKNASNLVNFSLPNYDDGYATSAPIGKFAPNHRGIYDIDGNVAEWVSDWFSSRSGQVGKKERVIENPLGPEEGEFHVIRGASWAKGYLPQLRLAYRDSGAKGRFDVGFRIARYIGEPK